MKKLCVTILCTFLVFSVFAGDVSQFVDVGFSPDGAYYMFGYYGSTDKTYQGYAELYMVDVKKNDFVSNGIFKTLPSKATTVTDKISSRFYFDELMKKADPVIVKQAISEKNTGLPLFMSSAADEKATEIEFRDFENAIIYSVKLISFKEEDKAGTPKSSFYLLMEQKNADGTVIKKYTVGNPSVKRANISAYSIDRVLTDKSGKNLVFVINKEITDAAGSSMRFMVETLSL